jgi:sec-independent protein translocase protein TatA
MDFSVWQIGIVLVIALLVFGPKRLPELGKSLGTGMREFRESITKRQDDESEKPRQLEGGTQAGAVEAAAPVVQQESVASPAPDR